MIMRRILLRRPGLAQAFVSFAFFSIVLKR